MYRHQQAALKKATSPDDGIKLFSQLAWTSRSQPLMKLLRLLALAVLCFVGVTLASGFSAVLAHVRTWSEEDVRAVTHETAERVYRRRDEALPAP